MKLPKKDADLFFKLMWGLQFYVNQRLHVLPDVDSVEEYAQLSSADKIEVRDVLWENPGLIADYVRENPDGLPAEEREIVRKWKRFVSGQFQIYRLLKKHAIFIGDAGKVYGVLGLYGSLEDLFSGRPLPVMVQAVLLPFKGRIVYDGLLKGYNILFGRGIRSMSSPPTIECARRCHRPKTTFQVHPQKHGQKWESHGGIQTRW